MTSGFDDVPYAYLIIKDMKFITSTRNMDRVR